MSQTNTKLCQDTRRGRPSHGGYCSTCRGNCNGDCGNSTFADSLFVWKLENNCISNCSITKSGPRLNQLKKILEALDSLCQDKHYGYIPYIICTNTKPTKEYFLSNHPIKRCGSLKHHVKLGFIDPIIGLDVISGTSPIDSEMVKITPIFNRNI